MQRSLKLAWSGRSVLATGAALAAAAGATAQTWIKQGPFPADAHPKSVFFLSPTEGWIAGEDHILLHTVDGGANWTQHPDFPRDPQYDEENLAQIQFVDGTHGFIGADHIYRTVDGGATWEDMGFHGQVGHSMEFLTPTLGFISTNGGVRRTTNGGQTFETVWATPASNMTFLNEQVGIISAGGDLYKTTDGGDTWSMVSTQGMTRLLYVDENIVIGSGLNTLYRSQDGGANWQTVASTIYGLGFSELEVIAGGSLVAVDMGFGIFISHDLGATWTRTQQTVGSWWPLWGVSVDLHFDASGGGQVGYAAGSGGVILKTTDGGQTWAQINSGGPMTLFDIDISPDGLAVAVGEQLTVLRTTDFGGHWEARSAQEPVIYPHMLTVQIADANTMVAGGEDGLFYRSNDAGATWTLRNNGISSDAYIYDLHFLDGQEGSEGWLFAWLIEGRAPAIYHTSNGGGSWTRIGPTKGNGLIGGQMVSPTSGWALDNANGLLRTNDNWETWTIVGLPGSNESYEHFQFIDAEVGWFSSRYGAVLKTTNGGVTFQFQELPGFIEGSGFGTDRGTDVVALSRDEAYITTYRTSAIERCIIYHTTDGGATWTPLEHFFDSTNVFAGRVLEIDVLPGGGIWAASIAGFIWAADIPEQSQPAALIDFTVTFGTLISGTLQDLQESDNSNVRARSRLGFVSTRTQQIDLRIGAETDVLNGSSLNISVEGRISQPGGNGAFRLRNWNTNSFEQVHTYPIGSSEIVETINDVPAANRIRQSDGRIELVIRHQAVAVFSASFDSFTDRVVIAVK